MNPPASKRVLVVQDLETAVQLRQVLLNEGYEVVETYTGEQALDIVTRQGIDIAIVEIALAGMDGNELCRQLRALELTRNMPILVLTAKNEVNDKVQAFQAGADDYLIKPFQTQELVYRLRGLLGRPIKHFEAPSKDTARGQIFALFGTKGGVGRTTIGVNLAVALQRRTKKKVVIFDADFFFGDIALHLNLPPAHTILDLVKSIDELDEEMVDQVLAQHSSGVRALISPRNPEEVDLITAAHIERLLDFLAATHDYVIVDCQTSYDERTLMSLGKADVILLIIRPEVGSVKNMAVFSELAAKLDLSFEKKIRIVLNRAGSKSGIGPKEIERIFRRQIAFRVPSGGNHVVVSVNRGVPLMIERPNHPFSVQVMNIADHLIRNTPPAAGHSTTAPVPK